jgi:hypothetical protein
MFSCTNLSRVALFTAVRCRSVRAISGVQLALQARGAHSHMLAVARAPPPAPSPARASFVSAAMPPSKGKNKHPSASHASLSRLPIFRKHRRREKRRPPIHCRRRSSSSSGVPGARSSRQRWMLFWHRRRSGPRDGSRGRRLGRLWLSEASMVGAGIRPGCLVSVSSSLLLFWCLGLVPST